MVEGGKWGEVVDLSSSQLLSALVIHFKIILELIDSPQLALQGVMFLLIMTPYDVT